MILLSRSEEIVLIAIWKLKNDAYGVTIREQVTSDTGHEWTFGSIYKPLKQIASKGYVKKIESDPTAERGGRSKFLYSVTSEGIKALKNIFEVQKSLWTEEMKLALK
ncbi:helix-turn-helix transcriptional regulator [candidate division KSB1 bacterium]